MDESFPRRRQERWLMHFLLSRYLCGWDGLREMNEPFLSFRVCMDEKQHVSVSWNLKSISESGFDGIIRLRVVWGVCVEDVLVLCLCIWEGKGECWFRVGLGWVREGWRGAIRLYLWVWGKLNVWLSSWSFFLMLLLEGEGDWWVFLLCVLFPDLEALARAHITVSSKWTPAPDSHTL